MLKTACFFKALRGKAPFFEPLLWIIKISSPVFLSAVSRSHYRSRFDAVGYRRRQPMGNVFNFLDTVSLVQ